jgi:hypothetical protein
VTRPLSTEILDEIAAVLIAEAEALEEVRHLSNAADVARRAER